MRYIHLTVVAVISAGALTARADDGKKASQTASSADPAEQGSDTAGKNTDLYQTIWPAAGADVDEKPGTVWTFAADTRVESVALSDVESALGLGLTYDTPRSQTRVIIRRGTNQSLVLKSAPSHESGTLLLSPQSLGLGVTAEFQKYFNAGYWCYTKSKKSKECDTSQPKVFNPQLGFYAQLNAGYGNAEVGADDEMADATNFHLTAVHLSGGFALRIYNSFGAKKTRFPVGISLTTGPSLRWAGGDLNRAERKMLFGGSGQPLFFGWDLGFRVQIASAWIGVTLSATYGTERVAGLTSAQVSPFLSFSLPFSIVTPAEQKESKSETTGLSATAPATGAANAAAKNGELAESNAQSVAAPAKSAVAEASEVVGPPASVTAAPEETASESVEPTNP